MGSVLEWAVSRVLDWADERDEHWLDTWKPLRRLGGLPLYTSSTDTPNENTSDFSPPPRPLSTSGAAYMAVMPAGDVTVCRMGLVRPKSQSLPTLSAETRILSGLMSKCVRGGVKACKKSIPLEASSIT